MRPKGTNRSVRRRRGAAGFTLIEMGMVIALLGLLAYLIADFHVNQLKLRNAERRADGAVRDVRAVIDASLAWAATDEHGRWPHSDVDNVIDIVQVQEAGLMPLLPQNRYRDCPGGCLDYTLTGWDRDATRTGGFLGDYQDTYTDAITAAATNPEDLIVRFTMPGGRAYAIAAQLPQGTATPLEPDPDNPAPAGVTVYRVEARVLRGGTSRFVLLSNEGRPITFARSATTNQGLGNLRNVGTINGAVGSGSPRIDLTSSGVLVTNGLSVQGGLTVGGCPVVATCP